jgi:hypothetical protein
VLASFIHHTHPSIHIQVKIPSKGWSLPQNNDYDNLLACAVQRPKLFSNGLADGENSINIQTSLTYFASRHDDHNSFIYQGKQSGHLD